MTLRVDVSGKSGDCMCAYTDEGALESAIAQARIQPWFTPASSAGSAPKEAIT
jgi:hypothetical protein